MKKILIVTSLLFLFFLTPEVAAAVSCKLTPDGVSEKIFVNISVVEVNCSGLDTSKKYVAAVIKNGDTPVVLRSSGHCDNIVNADGSISFYITPRHVEATYNIIIADKPLASCSRPFSPNIYWGPFNFTVTGAAQVTITPCSGFAGQGMMTALGCLPTKPDQFVVWFLRNAIGIGGGIAFLLIIWGAFTVITSAGNPEKLNNGKDIIVSAVTGLLMIIFSVVLLKIIGYDILGIPGFGK